MRKQTPSICTESVGAILIEVAGPCGKYNELHGFQIFSLSDALQQVEPIDFRHLQVTDNLVRLVIKNLVIDAEGISGQCYGIN